MRDCRSSSATGRWSGATWRSSAAARARGPGRIEAPIGRDRHDPTRHSLDTDTPREAITHFEVERLLRRHAHLDVRLETGRTHQIRVHLAAIDLPVVGDPVYGVPDPRLGASSCTRGASRFPHPLRDERVEVESPLPAELQAALARFDLVEPLVGDAEQRVRVAGRRPGSARAPR